MNPVENPVGVSGLTLAFLIAVLNLAALLFSLDPQVVASLSLTLAAGVAVVAEIVRRK